MEHWAVPVIALITIIAIPAYAANMIETGPDTGGFGAPMSQSDSQIEVTIMPETDLPGCEETSECYVPSKLSISQGETVNWINITMSTNAKTTREHHPLMTVLVCSR